MPVIKVYQHGVTLGMPPSKNNHVRAKRSIVSGWSASATRNNVKFLRSILPSNYSSSDEIGYTVTLTLKDCPPTARDWHTMRTTFIKRLDRMGLIRLHWVTEWQRRGVPHLHLIAYFPKSLKIQGGIESKIKSHWLEVAGNYSPNANSQHVKPVSDALGWFQYTAKHAARGVKHYQRSSENIPEGWQKKTGRMWGYVGNWDICKGGKLSVDHEFFYKFRRILRSWRIANARSECKKSHDQMIKKMCLGGFVNTYKLKTVYRRISQARKMLKCNDAPRSRVRGVSEWLASEHSLDISDFLVSVGVEVEALS